MNAQLVSGEHGVLRVFNETGVFAAADVHVARRVAALSGADIGDHELLAVALAVRAVRTGSTCVKLDEIGQIAPETPESDDDATPVELPWPDPADLVAALTTSPLVTGCPSGPLRPLALVTSDDGPLLYLRKYFRQEQTIREILAQRRAQRPAVDAVALAAALAATFGDEQPGGYDRQRAAAALAATSWTTVLAGGPGTGKTYTVARILAVMEELLGQDVRIGLCAPTGRAAAQMQASINDHRTSLRALHTEPAATTVHKLLGWRPDGSYRRGADDRLPYDVVVVDETSMLPVSMMSRLLESLRPHARLILVGDPHQLSSVDAGAVLADLVERRDRADTPLPEAFAAVAAPPPGEFGEAERLALADGVITLTRGHRYGGQISEVAAAIKAAAGTDVDAVVDLICGEGAARFADDAQGRVILVDPDDLEPVRRTVIDWARRLRDTATAGDARGALAALMAHRMLCAHRDGRHGVSGWSRTILGWINDDADARTGAAQWYPGEPILVNRNDPTHRIFNGDSGVVIADGDETSVVFARGKDIQPLRPSQIADSSPVYAMTIHRSQGSQFEAVTVVLPDVDAHLLTKELLYTAVTRAQQHVFIVGTEAELRAALSRSVQRASGLGSAVREIS